MLIQSLGIAIALATGPVIAPSAGLIIDLGLSAPIERLEDVESFTRRLAERLVWTVRLDGDGTPGDTRLRFTAFRIDRGRVTASYQSEPVPAPDGLSHIAGSLDAKAFSAFPDVCFTPEDPPARVRVISGTARLDAESLERAVASVARRGDVSRLFGLAGALDIEWGRQVLIILAATADTDDAVVRPLILVLERG